MRYRYYKPRRLPPLTPMRITEIYALAAVSVSIGTEAILHWELAHRDRDLCTIQTLAMCFRTNGGPFLEKSREKSTVESTRTWDELRAEFTNYPKDGSLAQKFVWWYNHAWSDPLVWGLLYEDQYLPVQKHKLEPTLSKGDWDILITHLANAMQGSDGKLSALAPWRFFRAFLLITPFALGARLLFLPRIVLPLSIAQRVLIYCSLTLYLNRTYQHCHYPLRLQDRHSVALVLNQLAPDLPEIVNTIMSGGRHFPL
ncbi:hypothetical protein PYCCODRAFT_1155081 [Trametes coccinea BRFM310]|uniref:Uncharacterized protein n=1 Tax=Trametes coccinea (strain BRFM310) TaxID=1353009 RepID=A0A1Y2IWR6_TRAC3|nr:hypothetical protein PYCCODRAFT_1155081 [Trametes coccinea BRFM310]